MVVLANHVIAYALTDRVTWIFLPVLTRSRIKRQVLNYTLQRWQVFAMKKRLLFYTWFRYSVLIYLRFKIRLRVFSKFNYFDTTTIYSLQSALNQIQNRLHVTTMLCKRCPVNRARNVPIIYCAFSWGSVKWDFTVNPRWTIYKSMRKIPDKNINWLPILRYPFSARSCIPSERCVDEMKASRPKNDSK